MPCAGRNRKRVNARRDQMIVEMLKAGISPKEIAAVHRVTVPRIYQLRTKHAALIHA